MKLTRRHAVIAGGFAAAVGLSRGIGLAFRTSPPTGHLSDEHKKITDLIREDPVPILSTADLRTVVSKDDVHNLLIQMLPLWDSLKTSRVLHAFRLWGPTATFPDNLFPIHESGKVYSGLEMASYLLDHRFYSRLLPAEEPLLYRTNWGVAVRNTPSGHQGQFVSTLAHSDDLLTACGELGLSSSHPVFAADRTNGEVWKATVADMITDSVSRFSIHQEMPWSAEALSRYLAPHKRWTNRFGISFSFDDIVQALLNIPIGEGPCLGTHTIYALVCLLRIDETFPIISNRMRTRISSHLKSICDRLKRAVVVGSGLWSGGWARDGDATESTYDFADVAATGHHLEWIALAPPNLRPTTGEIERVIHGTFRLLSNGWLGQNARSENYLNLSHLARALCLLSNTDPNVICHSAT